MGAAEKIKNSVNSYLDHKTLGKFSNKVKLIMRDREEMKAWKDQELRLATLAFRDDLAKGKKLDQLVVPAFALVNEVARRLFNKSPYEVQIVAGLVLHEGKIAEMKAGEGKTLTETMPVYLNALAGKGVHVITTNEYLAERDAKEMGKLFEFLGLSTGYITSSFTNEQRRSAYLADVTYVSNQEVGFDYLRDNLVFSRSERVLRREHALHYGIVDEIDSILIDESRTPLIVAEPLKEERNYYDQFIGIVKKLKEETDYVVDYTHKSVGMTNAGLDKVERMLGQPVFSKQNPMYIFYLEVCLKALTLFEKDRDYIVADTGVEIVDEFTGRVLSGRRFTDGVHQAIEAKEGVKVKEADRTTAAITFQNFFPMYRKLAGMSGTVMEAREEFATVYKLDVVQIPTNRPLARIDHNDLFFKTQKGKYQALIKKVRSISKHGQPILIGARNVETAHTVSEMLNQNNISHQLLTAQDSRSEAEKISRAGAQGMVTVATNMAGRGTDILLGPGVVELGGLYVLGTERHESRRIDNQLVGRAGRQGDPGESQFLISMEDEIMQLFGSEKIIDALEQYDLPEDEYLAAPRLDEAFRRAQQLVESKNFDSRIYLYKYDAVLSYQRKVVYSLREALLENPGAFEEFLARTIEEVLMATFRLGSSELVDRELTEVFGAATALKRLQIEVGAGHKQQWNSDVLNEYFNPLYRNKDAEQITARMAGTLSQHLRQNAMQLQGNPEIYGAAQSLILEIIDLHWSGHLDLMDLLKQEASLFSYASEDPYVDYILESKELFEHMMFGIKRQFLKSLFLYLHKRAA